ncbi:hypothetical protein TWF281_011119 [Arthrobotrys megalospora]
MSSTSDDIALAVSPIIIIVNEISEVLKDSLESEQIADFFFQISLNKMARQLREIRTSLSLAKDIIEKSESSGVARPAIRQAEDCQNKWQELKPRLRGVIGAQKAFQDSFLAQRDIPVLFTHTDIRPDTKPDVRPDILPDNAAAPTDTPNLEALSKQFRITTYHVETPMKDLELSAETLLRASRIRSETMRKFLARPRSASSPRAIDPTNPGFSSYPYSSKGSPIPEVKPSNRTLSPSARFASLNSPPRNPNLDEADHDFDMDIYDTDLNVLEGVEDEKPPHFPYTNAHIRPTSPGVRSVTANLPPQDPSFFRDIYNRSTYNHIVGIDPKIFEEEYEKQFSLLNTTTSRRPPSPGVRDYARGSPQNLHPNVEDFDIDIYGSDQSVLQGEGFPLSPPPQPRSPSLQGEPESLFHTPLRDSLVQREDALPPPSPRWDPSPHDETEPEPPVRVLTTDDALSYLDKFRDRFSETPSAYNQFLDIMNDFKAKAIDTADVKKQVHALLADEPDLKREFDIFLPPPMRQLNSPTASQPAHIQHVQSPQPELIQPSGAPHTRSGDPPQHTGWRPEWGLYHPSVPQQSISTTASTSNQSFPTTTSGFDTANRGQTTVETESEPLRRQPPGSWSHTPKFDPESIAKNLCFDDAIGYINQVKDRYLDKPWVYHDFINVLKEYQQEPVPASELYNKASQLFGYEPDLLDGLKVFFPNDIKSSIALLDEETLEEITEDANHRAAMQAAAQTQAEAFKQYDKAQAHAFTQLQSKAFIRSHHLQATGLRDIQIAPANDGPIHVTHIQTTFPKRGLEEQTPQLAPSVINSESEWQAAVLEELSPVEGPWPEATDSGYASMAHQRHEQQRTHDKSEICERTSMAGPSPAVEDVLDFDDTQTVYSDASSVTTLAKENYISELADALFRNLCADQLDGKTLERISAALPDLLKAFALKVGHDAPSQMHRDVMFFVHKNRGDVAEHFRGRCSREEAENLDTHKMDLDNMALNDKMAFWLARSEYLPVPEQGPIAEEKYDNDDEEVGQLTLAYRDFIFKTPAFEWLVGSLRRDVLLTPMEPNSMETIRNDIIGSLPSSRKVSKTKSAEAFRVIFTTNWKPLEFISDQGYKDEPGEAIESAITLTGTLMDAQALTCTQYLSQTWPQTGKHIVQLLKDVLREEPGSRHMCILPDNTKLVMFFLRSRELVVEASGTGHSVAEIGQQLAWLVAALSSSPYNTGVAACIPSICVLPQVLESAVPDLPGISCKLNFTLRHEEEAPSNGQCWHKAFRNPVVVGGYPILRRSNLETSQGLEIPLNMMAGLAGTQYIQKFDEKIFIKGFSTLLVPTGKDGDILTWHLLYNEDGDRISYLGNNVLHAEGLSLLEVETARHVLGWCPKADYYAGAANANYNVKQSGLSKPRGDDYALEGTYIQGRRLIRGGLPFSIGNKDTPFHISRENPIQRLQWIDRKFFVLWDEEDKRGWLVNGTSALLHLLRKSLENNSDSSDKFHFEFCFKKELMQEAPVTHKTFSAIRVLRNDTNLKQEIYPKTEGYFRVENRLDELFDILEKIIDHQISITRQDTDLNPEGSFGTKTNTKNKTREHLEGWDFNDLAAGEDPIYPRVATFRKPSGGWVDFTRAIHAVSLFGRGFGEIIQPEVTSCTRWAKLPTGEYYLAAAVDDLKEIMKKNGDQYSNPMRLTDDLIWHTPKAIFEKCKCRKKKRKGRHSDFIQVPLPTRLCNFLPNKGPILLNNSGAVVFGNSRKLKGLLKSSEDLEDSEHASSSEESDIQSRDSGVGSSLTQSSVSNPAFMPNPTLRPSSTFMSNSTLRSSSTFTPDPTLRPSSTFMSISTLISTSTFTCDDYKVGIVCALPKELLAIRALFDHKHPSNCLTSLRGDINHYALGHIYPHNVVAACLPSGEYGTTAAASVYSHMRRSFPQLKICLLVGIGGGVPSKNVRLGDVVVSHPAGNYPGVIQYDLGKTLDNDVFECSGSLQRPPQFILTAISNLTSDPDVPVNPLEPYLREVIQRRPEYRCPGQQQDPQFRTTCLHGQHDGTSLQCNCPPPIPHLEPLPKIHYGLIASGNQVMKNAQVRDRLSDKFNVLCFEMEAAGVMNAGNFLVIRGICDYCDSEKNDIWQEYAAATAAAYAKLLLSKTTIPGDGEIPVGSSASSSSSRSMKRAPSSEHSSIAPSKKPRKGRTNFF